MAILAIRPFSIGAVGEEPSILKILTDDTVATVTTAGYLSNYGNWTGIEFSNYQAAFVYTTDGYTNLYQVNVSAGVASLAQEEYPNSVQVFGAPVTDKNFAVFHGTAGNIQDLGYAPSDPDQTVVGMVDGATIAGNFAVYSDTAGTTEDLIYSPSDESKTKVVMATAATTVNKIPKFTDTAGTIGDGYTPSNTAKTVVVMANATVTANHIPSYTDTAGTIGVGYTPSDTAKTVAVMMNSTAVVGDLAKFSDVNGTITESNITAATVLIAGFFNPDINSNIVTKDITVSAAALASGASVTLQASSGSKQYKIRQLFVNSNGTNFSGGGGDRLLSITDNTTVYSVVPAASLQTLANTGWGVTGLPFPASAALSTSTAAGAALVAKYSGGAADYGAGSVVISLVLERVA